VLALHATGGKMRRLSLSCLGPFQVTLDGQPVTTFKSVKVRALLAYLAVEAGRPHPRQVLAGLLWPDWPDRDALVNLRSALFDLRKAIGDRTASGDREASPPFLLITRDTLQFNAASDHQLDVAAFLELIALGDLPDLEEAVRMYRGSFLEGFSVGDSAPFEEWALFTRERLARKMSATLHRLAEGYEQRGDYAKARSFARRQIELEPWDEGAHRQLMRALVLDGQRSAALAQYETCCRLLDEELGVEPAAETTALYEQIRTSPAIGEEPARRPEAAPPPAFLEAEEEPYRPPVFVARKRELALLDRFLDLALAGQGRVVFVTGDAGSGKTALVQEFARRAQEAHADLIVASGNCNAYTGIGDPYLPFREILELLSGDVEARWAAGAMTGDHARRLWNTLPLAVQALTEVGPDLIDTFVPRAALLERARTCAPGRADWLTRLGELVERKPTGLGIPSAQQSYLFEQYTKVLQSLARQVPLVLVLDDLQWADLGSISLLFHLGRQLVGSRILILGAYRPEEVALGRDGERHPLEPVVHELQRDFGDITVSLGLTEGRGFIEAFLDSEPNRLGGAFREMLYRQTRGQPLFTIELLRGLQEQGDLVKDGEGYSVEGPALDWDTLPARVEAVIAERIGRLAQPLQAALRVASVEGEVFTAEVVARVQAASEGEVVGCLSRDLDRRHRLVRAQGILWMDGQRLSRYRFRHTLLQRYLYNSLDAVERAHLHAAVGDTLETLHKGQTEAMAAIAGQLAWHFQEAGMAAKAIDYLRQAGDRAVRLCAYREAIAHLSRGLEMLLALPGSPECDQQELALQLSLGTAWIRRGALGPEQAGPAFARARELCEQMGKESQLCQVLGELAVFHYLRAEHHRALELAEEALSLAQQFGDPVHVALGHWQLGVGSFGLGEYTAARAHLQQVISFYEPQEHHQALVSLRGLDAGVASLSFDACCLWALGYPEQASKRSEEVLALARELDHPFSLADGLAFGGCMYNRMRREPCGLKDAADELLSLSQQGGFPGWLAIGSAFQGAATAMLGQLQEGIAQMREGMAAGQTIGMRFDLPGSLCTLAEALAKAGQPEQGLVTLAEAFALVEETDGRHWEAELHRVQGELLLMQGDDAEAEASLHKAIEVARGQSAKSWGLRATTSLARLWQKQGKQEEARRVLAEIHGWFTEGFDTPDLQEAEALLAELANSLCGQH
jgi:DNA-binding SARP family transcriptional activator/predicted ATPase